MLLTWEIPIQMTRSEKIAANKLDKEIEAVYRKNCANIPIDIMDINSVFAAGRKAKAEGRDLALAITAFVESIRKDK